VARPRIHGFETLGDMLRSLAVVFLFIAFLLVLTPRRHYDAVKEIDYTAQLRAARAQAPYAVLAPEGLPDRWRPTSARLEREGDAVTWHLGFVTPADEYAAVGQSDGDRAEFLDRQSNGGQAQGSVEIGGVRWDRYFRQAKNARTLARSAGGVLITVGGTAGYPELEQLAGALR
jgi:Protein of unknown function (DUF4245)